MSNERINIDDWLNKLSLNIRKTNRIHFSSRYYNCNDKDSSFYDNLCNFHRHYTDR